MSVREWERPTVWNDGTLGHFSQALHPHTGCFERVVHSLPSHTLGPRGTVLITAPREEFMLSEWTKCVWLSAQS